MHYAYPNITGDIGQGMSLTGFLKNRVEKGTPLAFFV